MNEKEFNLAILAELRRIAKEVFSKVTVSKEGTYTAAELWNGKNALGENITLFIDEADKHTYTAEVGTFKFTVSYEDIFLRLWKFEKLCKVRDEKKARFTFGAVESEIISEKAMYKSNGGKIITRKKTMVKVEENVAYSVEKSNVNIFVLYFLANGIWYAVGEAANKESVKSRAKLLMQKDFILNNLTRRPELMDETMTAVAPIFKELYEVLATKVCNDAKEKIKSENKAENTINHENKNTPDWSKPTTNCIVMVNRLGNGAYHCKQFLLNEIGNGLYKDEDNLFFRYGEYCYLLGGYTRGGVATFLKEQPDITAKIVSMIEEGSMSTESVKILYEKLTGHVLGETAKEERTKEETHEDYPPEPYNEKDVDAAQTVTKTVTKCRIERESSRIIPIRQKVFPTELFYAKRKISRFKPRYFAEYTNYRLCKESALERKRNGNTSVYRAFVRGETGISSG